MISSVAAIREILAMRLDQKILVGTHAHRLGLASKYAQVGDQIALLAGCNLPMVFRPDGSSWEMIAPAFIHGNNVMEGGLWKDDMDLQEFMFI